MNGGEAFISIAAPLGADLQRDAYHQDLVHGTTGESQAFAEVAEVEHHFDLSALPAEVAQMMADSPHYPAPGAKLPPHIPDWAAGAADARIGALAFAHKQLVRCIDLETLTIEDQQRFDSVVHCVALSADGRRLAAITADGPLLFADRGRRLIARVGGWQWGQTIAWCAGHWAVSVQAGNRFEVQIRSALDGTVVAVVPLIGRPYSVAAAAHAPLVAYGCGRQSVVVVDVNERRSRTYEVHRDAPDDNGVKVAICPQGECVASRGTLDQQLYALGRGSDEAIALGTLPVSDTTHASSGHMYHTKPAFDIVAGGLVTVVDGVWTFRSDALPDPAADSWLSHAE